VGDLANASGEVAGGAEQLRQEDDVLAQRGARRRDVVEDLR